MSDIHEYKTKTHRYDGLGGVGGPVGAGVHRRPRPHPYHRAATTQRSTHSAHHQWPQLRGCRHQLHLHRHVNRSRR